MFASRKRKGWNIDPHLPIFRLKQQLTAPPAATTLAAPSSSTMPRQPKKKASAVSLNDLPVYDLDRLSDEKGNEVAARGGVACPFPWRLHECLEAVEKEGLQHIVSWQPHGRAFTVYEPDKFVELVMPRFFGQTKFPSFQRQLNIYGFSRFTHGKDKGAYYHLCFVRGHRSLVRQMIRRKIKGNKHIPRKSLRANHDFYHPAWKDHHEGSVPDALSKPTSEEKVSLEASPKAAPKKPAAVPAVSPSSPVRPMVDLVGCDVVIPFNDEDEDMTEETTAITEPTPLAESAEPTPLAPSTTTRFVALETISAAGSADGAAGGQDFSSSACTLSSNEDSCWDMEPYPIQSNNNSYATEFGESPFHLEPEEAAILEPTPILESSFLKPPGHMPTQAPQPDTELLDSIRSVFSLYY